MYRIPVSSAARDFIFPKDMKGYNRKNQAFFVPTKDKEKFSYIFSLLEANSKSNFEKALNGWSEIPCGQCSECRLNKSKEWAVRGVAESMLHTSNYFLTLTYDDEHIPPGIWTYNRENFEFGFYHPLVYKDFELFKKRLLRHFEYHYGVNGIRFLMCGEYGPSTHRPHFHVIFYNLPLTDLKKVSSHTVGGKKVTYLESKVVEDCWGKGFVTIGECNYDTISYVSRYVMKKFIGKQEESYQLLCKRNMKDPLPPEIRNASRNPGLGRPYFEKNKVEIYEYDKIVLPNGRFAKPVKYFDYLLNLEDPELLKKIKDKRHINNLIKINNRNSGLSDEEIQEKKDKHEAQLEKRLKKLKRPI